MELNYQFAKAKLPKGLSYPLKRSLLDAALLEGGVTDVVGVSYTRGDLKPGSDPRAHHEIVLSADFCGEGRQIASYMFRSGYMHISVYAVLSKDRKNIEVPLVGTILPRVVAWIRALETAPRGSTRRGVDQCFKVKWGELGLVEYAS